MIATMMALALLASPPEGPRPPTPRPAIDKPDASAAKAKAKAEAARKAQERNRLRALNSRRRAGMEGFGTDPSRGANPRGSANRGGYSAGAGVDGNFGASTFGGGDGGFGGGWVDPGLSSFEQQLAATFGQAQGAMAAGQAALAATASLS